MTARAISPTSSRRWVPATGASRSPALNAAMRALSPDSGRTMLRATAQAMATDSSSSTPISAAPVRRVAQNVSSMSVMYSAEAIIRCQGAKPRT